MAAALAACGGTTKSEDDTAGGTDAEQTDTGATDALVQDVADTQAGTDAAAADAADTTGGTDATTDIGPDVTATTGELTVFAYANNQLPIPKAKVELVGSGIPAQLTTGIGNVVFSGLTPGVYTINVTAAGFAVGASKVTVAAGQNAAAGLVLAAHTALATLDVGVPATVNAGGVKMSLPSVPFVNKTGALVEAPVQAAIAGVSANGNWTKPTSVASVLADGSTGPNLHLVGGAEISFSALGQPVQLASGVTVAVSIDLPVSATKTAKDGDSLQTYWLDTATANWKPGPVGKIAVVGGKASVSFVADHFTYWVGADGAAMGCVTVQADFGGGALPDFNGLWSTAGQSWRTPVFPTGASIDLMAPVGETLTLEWFATSTKPSKLSTYYAKTSVVVGPDSNCGTSPSQTVTMNLATPRGCVQTHFIDANDKPVTPYQVDTTFGLGKGTGGFQSPTYCAEVPAGLDGSMDAWLVSPQPVNGATAVPGVPAGPQCGNNGGNDCVQVTVKIPGVAPIVPAAACGNYPVGTRCDDGNACTLDEKCAGSSCIGAPKPCSDGVACTQDTCNPSTGDCENALSPGCVGGTCGAGVTCASQCDLKDQACMGACTSPLPAVELEKLWAYVDCVKNNCAGPEDNACIQSKCANVTNSCFALDTDKDGTPDAQDCGASDAAIHPGATEVCNGIDDNCDGLTDSGDTGCGTAKVCLDGKCVASAVECLVDTDCDDGRACTADSCKSGVCSHGGVGLCAACDTVADCPTTASACTSLVCTPQHACVRDVAQSVYGPQCNQKCTFSGECNDGAACTTDVCFTGNCSNAKMSPNCILTCDQAQLWCANYGQCQDTPSGPVCACLPGFEGPTCAKCVAGLQDNDKDGSCTPTCATANPTCGAGSCDDNSGTVKCVCQPGYVGAACDTCDTGFQDNDQNGLCAPTCATAGLNCTGGGICSDASGTATCGCQVGTQDNDQNGSCQPDCANAGLSCGPGGTCSDSSGSAICVCSTGYVGASCELCDSGFQDNDKNSTCQPSCTLSGVTCPSNGYCADTTGTAVCACQPHWTGSNCDACDTGYGGTKCDHITVPLEDIALGIFYPAQVGFAQDKNGDLYVEMADAYLKTQSFYTRTSGAWAPALYTISNNFSTMMNLFFDSKGVAHTFEFVSGSGTDFTWDTVNSAWVPNSTTALSGIWNVALHSSADEIHTFTVFADNTPTYDLWYANNAGGTWTNAVALTTGTDVRTFDAVLDAAGKPHAVYAGQNDPGTGLQTTLYSVSPGVSGWTTETVEVLPAGVNVASISVKFDAAGHLHALYTNSVTGTVNHATNASGTWLSVVVATVDPGVQDVVLGFDSTGAMHAVWVDSSTWLYQYASNYNGSWQVYTLDTENAGPWGAQSRVHDALLVDAQDVVHLALAVHGTHHLYHVALPMTGP